MSDKSNQQISNLMDGELEVSASKFLLKRMASDSSLSQTWDKYHLIKSCLQKQKQEPLMIDIAQRVSEQLSNEKQYGGNVIKPKEGSDVQNSRMQKWLKPIMGLGIAASVAFTSVFLLQNQSQNPGMQVDSSQKFANTSTQTKAIEPFISARPTLATSSKTFVPPPSLSRFPSNASTYQNSVDFSQKNSVPPYILIINQPRQVKNKLSPMRNESISD